MWPWVTGTEVQDKQVSESVTKQYDLTYCNAQMPLPVRVSLVPWAHINLPQTLLRLGFFCTLLPNLQNLMLYNVFQCARYHSKVKSDPFCGESGPPSDTRFLGPTFSVGTGSPPQDYSVLKLL